MPQQSDYFDSLEAAITIGHKCQSVHRATVFVHERTEYGLTIWKGNVEVFSLKHHPTRNICYAWQHNDGVRSSIFTILGDDFIDSAQKAVQATICAGQQPIKLIPPLTNGLEILRQHVEQARKIIHQTEIKSEELLASIDASVQNYHQIKRRIRPVQRADGP